MALNDFSTNDCIKRELYNLRSRVDSPNDISFAYRDISSILHIVNLSLDQCDVIQLAQDLDLTIGIDYTPSGLFNYKSIICFCIYLHIAPLNILVQNIIDIEEVSINIPKRLNLKRENAFIKAD